MYVPYMAAIAAGAKTGALQALVLTAAAQRLRRYEPELGTFGGFPTGSSPRRLADRSHPPHRARAQRFPDQYCICRTQHGYTEVCVDSCPAKPSSQSRYV